VSLRVSYKKQVLLMIMILFVLLLVIEGILRVYDFFNPRCDFMENEVSKNLDYFLKLQICDTWTSYLVYNDPISGISSGIPNQHYPNLNINGYGFRGPEIVKEKPDNTVRIFVVGGSTTYSIRALSDQQTIPGHLQENFDKLQINNKIEVVNAGIPSIASTDELQLVQTKIIQFDPDLIIIYDGSNDLTHSYPWIKPKNESNVFGTIQYFYRTIYVLHGIFDPKIPKTYDKSDWYDKALLWKQNMIKICELGKKHGYETFIILQPILGSGNKTLSEHEIKNIEFWDQAKAVIGYQKFADELNDLNNYCIGTADLRNIFDNVKGDVYFDYAHIDSEHNKIVADKIFELALPLVN